MRSEGVVVQAGELKIFGRLFASHVSPVETLQSCISLQSVGVIHAKFGVVASVPRSIASCG
jgi:hypothetical protein